MRKSWRTVGLWFFLVVCFAAGFQLFNTGSGAAQAHTGSPTLWLPSVARWLALVVVIFLAVFFIGRTRKAYGKQLDGARLLYSGRYLQALEAFQAAPSSAAIKHSIGFAQLALWRVREAQATFVEVEPVPKTLNGITRGTEGLYAIAAALLGDLVTAKAWLGAASLSSAEGIYELASALVCCREGAFATALTHLKKPEVAHLGGYLRGLAQALYSFAMFHVSGATTPVERIVLFGEVSPDGLKLVWPELSDVVEKSPAG